MRNRINDLLSKLKHQLGPEELTDYDFYESEEIAEVSFEEMFDYFLGNLDEAGVARLERFARESRLFLSNLVDVGEIVLDANDSGEEGQASPQGLTWLDLKDLANVETLGSMPAIELAARVESESLEVDLGSTHLAAAATQDVSLGDSLPSGIEMEVFEDGNTLVIDLTTPNLRLAGQLVGFCLSGEDQPVIGVTLLQAGDSGIVSGGVVLDRTRLAGAYRLSVVPVDNSDLSQADFDLVRQAIDRDSGDDLALTSWTAWVDSVRASDDGPGLSGQLDQLSDQLRTVRDR